MKLKNILRVGIASSLLATLVLTNTNCSTTEEETESTRCLMETTNEICTFPYGFLIRDYDEKSGEYSSK